MDMSAIRNKYGIADIWKSAVVILILSLGMGIVYIINHCILEAIGTISWRLDKASNGQQSQNGEDIEIGNDNTETNQGTLR